MYKKTNLFGYPIIILLTVLLTLSLSNCNTKSEPTKEEEVPKEIISYKDAVELYQTYTENRACIIKVFEGKKDSTLDSLCPSKRKPNEKFVPSRSFHLDKKFLDDYISYINRITPDSIKITGYRLYLGNYPDKKRFDDGKPIPDPRRNTFFITPTTLIDGSNIHRGFTFVDRNNDGKPEILYLEDELERGQQPYQNSNSPKGKINTASFFSFSSSAYGGAYSTIGNEVGGYPPNIQ
ncbi:hypothetical protein [Aquimarina aquimarini]|uniref:hypothetical protein n=1 Tax=Aquimarina aquimarini TaxID=1191734 RepID=UPI000D55BED5|nr:hypothetical protein [Aquimarina aquimarini]